MCETLAVVLGDVTDPSTSKQAVTSAIEQFGHLDGVILNAGVLYPMGTVASIPVDATASDGGSSSSKLSPTDTWKSLFDVNFFSLIYTVQEALPALRGSPRKGRIIMVSSGASVKGQYGWGPYAASKAAVNSLVKTLATEEPNIATIAIRPGVVDTDMQTLLRSSTDALRTEASNRLSISSLLGNWQNPPTPVMSSRRSRSQRRTSSLVNTSAGMGKSASIIGGNARTEREGCTRLWPLQR
ncbi:hypothetical protein FRC16_010965 [Serendipita sp. 398]|nr:hypothetical protein FRC16_010965 [Serendipita sp. 398]